MLQGRLARAENPKVQEILGRTLDRTEAALAGEDTGSLDIAMERAPTEAEKLNTEEPGNVAGKPVLEGTPIDADLDDDAREQVDPSAHDDVWAAAVVLDHEG